MTANTNLERRVAEHYAGEPPVRAPDRVLLAALAAIDTTPQRRGPFAPWRFTHMSTYAKVAAAVAVIAVIAVGYWQLAPKQGSSGGTATPSPSLGPTAGPTASPTSTTGVYVPPALTETFTSDLHGLSVSYPAGWAARAATEPWTDADPPQFGDPDGDLLSDPARDEGHFFISIASQPLGATSFDEWLVDFLAAEGCARADPITISGADEAIDTSCNLVLASSDGRAYLFFLYTSDDEADLRSFDAEAWLDEIAATVELHPEDAVDEAPTASP